jgi:hypothetical protein
MIQTLQALTLTSEAADRAGSADTLVALEYPNGRIHVAILRTPSELQPGDEFDLHGRRWRAVRLTRGRKASKDTPLRMLCQSTEPPNVSA